MEVSKIQLSPAERELIKNAEIILTKNRVLEKVKALLDEVQQQQLAFVSAKDLKDPVFSISPKISKGENYLGLPYLILDYPRQSSEGRFFFIRTMFWWGNFFSCTLHLAANSKEQLHERIVANHKHLENYFVSISNDPWVHHLGPNEYREISSLSLKELETVMESFDHVKIAGKYDLSEWEEIPSKLYENWKVFLKVCGLIA